MNPKYIDIHSHLQFAAFDEDREEVLKRALDAGVWMINVGTQYDTSKNAIALANSVPEGVYATVALHPIHTTSSYHDPQELGSEILENGHAPWRASASFTGFTSRGEQFDYVAYKKLAEDPKVVAIGECGLDYYHVNGSTSSPQATLEKQKEVFEAHVRLAGELGKPLMLHIRNSLEPGINAYQDTLAILKSIDPKARGDVHFFAGSLEDARAFLDQGFTLSFTGVITYPKSKKAGVADYEELIKFVPLDMIMAETDCPYIAPAPFRGKRNEPAYVEYVYKRIAEIKGVSESDVTPILLANAKRVFKM